MCKRRYESFIYLIAITLRAVRLTPGSESHIKTYYRYVWDRFFNWQHDTYELVLSPRTADIDTTLTNIYGGHFRNYIAYCGNEEVTIFMVV